MAKLCEPYQRIVRSPTHPHSLPPPTSRCLYFASPATALVLMNYTYLADAYSASLSASVLCCLPTTAVVTFDAGSALEVESV